MDTFIGQHPEILPVLVDIPFFIHAFLWLILIALFFVALESTFQWILENLQKD